MTHGLATPGHQTGPAPRALAPVARALAIANHAIVGLSMIALVLAAAILTWSVLTRYFFKSATDWQDEAAVFLLVGATFLCGAYVQSYRGHVGIDAIASILPEAVNRIRRIAVDLATCLFCAFFAWKSWTLFHEALIDGQTTSSSWAPPLAIPYGLMAFGMSLLALQVLLQLATEIVARPRHHR
jgi:TRAP-type C4-dicarboxylate transport system permease small subunit